MGRLYAGSSVREGSVRKVFAGMFLSGRFYAEILWEKSFVERKGCAGDFEGRFYAGSQASDRLSLERNERARHSVTPGCYSSQ